MILTLALRSRARGRPRPNIFSRRLEALGSPGRPSGRSGVGHRFARQDGPAGFYGRGYGFGVGVVDLALGMGAPELAGELVQNGRRAARDGGFEKLIG